MKEEQSLDCAALASVTSSPNINSSMPGYYGFD